jgi:predicted metal-dependent phosphotriesterase family hydrolase
MQRREFLNTLATVTLVSAAAGPAAKLSAAPTPKATRSARSTAGASDAIMTVRGAIAAGELGRVLPHEHVLVDFIGADQISPDRYDPAVAFAKIEPFLQRVRALGFTALFECTPAFLGRDPRLLVRLSEATGLHLVTNTGYYAARQNKFVPAHALQDDADALAARWTREWHDGIDGTGVRPGFIKLGVDAGPLTDTGRKLVAAAARTHRASGLTIAVHSGDHVAAREQLAILTAEGVRPDAWIWVHAQNAKDEEAWTNSAQAGGWVSFDGVSPRSLARHVHGVLQLKRAGLLGRVLVSQDAGWYRPGEPDGGQFRDFEFLARVCLPKLREEGVTEAEIDQLTIRNPAEAFAVRPRLA